jgi:predicted regulator of Ras-like GTPase activity (Roadblock/LC7/MglB family)
MDAAQAIGELMELSSQITAAIAHGEDGSILPSSTDDQAAVASLSSSAVELVSAAADLGPDGGEVTRVEVELAVGAFFVVREGDRTVAATTGPKPTSGLVVYDLRTCAQAIDSAPKKKRAARKPKEESE